MFAGDFAGVALDAGFAAVLLAAGAFAAGLFATGALAAGTVLAALAAGTAMLVSSAGGVDEFEFASAVFELASAETAASAGASGLLDSTETLPFNAGIASSSADSMKHVAATMVTFDSTVAVPRGLNAELETLLVNNAPASVLPGCSRTAPIKARHEMKNIT